MAINSVIFREYDIRGVVDKDYDADFAYQLGRAHIAYIKRHLNIDNPTVTVGHDARLSSPKLSDCSTLSNCSRSSASTLTGSFFAFTKGFVK